MTSPPENTGTTCEKVVRDETVLEPDITITDNAQKLPYVDVSKIAESIPRVAFTRVAISDGTFWLRRLAFGALRKADGVWMRTVKIITTYQGHVDSMCPIAKTAYLYHHDGEVYDSTLTEKSTGITYISQLIFDDETKVYYVYNRWGETDYKIDGPYGTMESAKKAFHVSYKENFDVEWKEREIATSERLTYEVKTYETFEEIEEVEEVVEETQAELIIARKKEIEVEDTTITEETTTTVTEEVVTLEHETKQETVVIADKMETVKEIITEKETGKVDTPAASEKSSWFRRAISGAKAPALGVATGADYLATGALKRVDGVWKRTVQVLTTRKAKVDHVCPIAATSYVYHDDEVYDSVLTEKSTGITYVTQLIFDSETKVYYVYYRWGEIDYTLNGPHKTIESAKEAFQVSYKEKFGHEWMERYDAISEKWSCEIMVHETFEEVEEVEEVIDELEAELIIAQEKLVVVDDTKITEETTTTVTTEEVTLEHLTEETVVVEEDMDPFILEKTRPLAEGKKSGSAGLSTIAIAAVVTASLM